MQILLECARVRVDGGALRAAASAVRDWSPVLTEAERHGLQPLVQWQLSRICPEVVPPDAADHLRRRFLESAARNLLMGAELVRVSESLEREGLRAIAYKGPTLTSWVYENPALREFSDLDVLVRREDLDRAVSVLAASGCRPRGAAGAEALAGNCEVGMNTPRGCPLDLHWAVSPPYFPGLPMAGVFERRHPVDLEGGRVATFGPEDLFTCLVLHASRHCWESLRWIADVARLVAATSLDWDVILAPVRTRRMSLVALLLASDLCPGEVPPKVIESARQDKSAVVIARHVWQELFRGGGPLAGRPSGAGMQLRMLRPPDKARYLWRRAMEPNQTDNEFMPLPAPLRPLLTVIRPFRILSKLASRV